MDTLCDNVPSCKVVNGIFTTADPVLKLTGILAYLLNEYAVALGDIPPLIAEL